MCNFPDLNCFLLKPDLSGEAGVDYVQAWLAYKAGYYCEGDPDSSCEARDFYRTMWGEFLNYTGFELRPKPREFSKNPEKYVQGDWMCSVATTLRKGLVLYVKKHTESKIKGPRDGVGGYNTYVPALLEDIKKEKPQYSEIWGDHDLQNFIRSAYTYANLIIVPDGFNSRRSKKPTDDYWDEALSLYFNGFYSKPPLQYRQFDVGTPFHKLVKASRDNGSDSLFLDEWLDKDEDDKSKPLRDKKLTKLKDWRDLMKEMTVRIDNRREQMRKWIKTNT